MWPNPQEKAYLITFTEEILNGKLHFVYSDADIENSIFGNFSCGARYLLDLFFTTSIFVLKLLDLRFYVLLKKRYIRYAPLPEYFLTCNL